MNNNTINQNNSKIMAAILARLTAGKPDRADELNSLLDSVDEPLRSEISKSVLEYGVDTDLRSLSIAKETESEIRYVLHWAAEALSPQPPINWIVKPIFSPGTVSLVVGNPGSKKTYSLLDLGICVSTGKPWLDFETTQGTVLLIDEESGGQRLNQRLRDIMLNYSANEKTKFAYITLEQINLRESEDVIAITSLIKEINASLIFIDALADVMPGADENAVKDVQPLLMNLRNIADDTQSAIVVIHHSNKQGEYRGSSALLGAVDNLIMVESKSGDENIKFKMVKNRDGEPLEFFAAAHFEQDKFWLSSTSSKPKSTFSGSQLHVLQHFSKYGPCSIKDIQNQPGTFSEQALKKALTELVHSGYVKRIDGGGSGKKATYDLTDNGKEYANTLLTSTQQPVTYPPL